MENKYESKYEKLIFNRADPATTSRYSKKW